MYYRYDKNKLLFLYRKNFNCYLILLAKYNLKFLLKMVKIRNISYRRTHIHTRQIFWQINIQFDSIHSNSLARNSRQYLGFYTFLSQNNFHKLTLLSSYLLCSLQIQLNCFQPEQPFQSLMLYPKYKEISYFTFGLF